MPPKAKITRDMIAAAGFDIVRSEGQDSLNVRRIAAQLGCSTQPVMYHFSTVGELKAAVYAVADRFHTQYIMTEQTDAPNPMLSIGMNFILFAYKEKNLFRFLFQSDSFKNVSFTGLLEGDGASGLLQPLMQHTGLTLPQAKRVFEALFTCVHGYASLLANNSIELDEDHCIRLLTDIFKSSVGFFMRGEGS